MCCLSFLPKEGVGVMFGFEAVKQRPKSNRGRHPHERRVIRGIIHKKCPICQQWVPETEFHKSTINGDAKQGYCRKCKSLYMHWRFVVCRHYRVKHLNDIPGFVQPERGQEMRRYINDIRLYKGEKL